MNLHDIITSTDYQNEPIISNLAKLSGTTSHAVCTYLIEIALNSSFLSLDEAEEIAEGIITFYNNKTKLTENKNE